VSRSGSTHPYVMVDAAMGPARERGRIANAGEPRRGIKVSGGSRFATAICEIPCMIQAKGS
jgi:hypothetical protein